MRRNYIKRTREKKTFNDDLSSIDDIPSIITSRRKADADGTAQADHTGVNIKKALRDFSWYCDDRLEYFRQSVSEMLSSAQSFAARTAARTWVRVRAARRAHGRFQRNDWMQRRLIRKDKMVKAIRESQFSDIVKTLARLEKKALIRSDYMRYKWRKVTGRAEHIADVAAEYLLNNRKKCMVAAGTAMAIMIAFCVTINAATVYNYSYHGKQLGTVKDKTEIEEAAAQVSDTVDTNVDVSVNPEEDVTYTKEIKFSADTDTAETAADKIANAENLTGNGYAIIVNGKTAALVDSEETADKILDEVKAPYCTVDGDGNSVVNDDPQASVSEETEDTEGATSTSTEADFASDQDKLNALHKIIEANTALSQLLSAEDSSTSADTADSASQDTDTDTDATTDEDSAVSDDTTDSVDINTEISEVKDEQTLRKIIDSAAEILTAGTELGTSAHPAVFSADISTDSLTFDEIVEIEPVTANVDAFLEYDQARSIFIGEDGTSNLLTVSTSEIQVFTRTVAYETVYEDDPTMYEGETEVKTEGSEGISRATVRVYRVNGEETYRDELSDVIIQEPVAQVILKGTKEKPSTEASGTFIKPVSGTLSSGFGSRWGRQHQGIDLAASYGSDVVAADGGTVIYAGYNSSGYGNLVKIDHGNGYVTYYAHNSSLCVSVGDKVAQGQVIAKVGSTGRSTGNHCHFEIRINGTAVNPLPYIQ